MTRIKDEALGARIARELEQWGFPGGKFPNPGKCRTGCPTQDHASYAECVRGLHLNSGMSGTTDQKKHDAELRAYKRARSQGIQPLGTKMHQVEQAMKISDATGVAFGG